MTAAAQPPVPVDLSQQDQVFVELPSALGLPVAEDDRLVAALASPPPPLACILLPHFALQVLARRIPDCLAFPAVVVAEDRPQGLVREVNRLARAARILPGMRYAAALALCADLRAGVVEARDEALAALELAEVLRQFSPRVEPSSEEHGVFWLDTSGLASLWPDLRAWAAEATAALRDAHSGLKPDTLAASAQKRWSS